MTHQDGNRVHILNNYLIPANEALSYRELCADMVRQKHVETRWKDLSA